MYEYNYDISFLHYLRFNIIIHEKFNIYSFVYNTLIILCRIFRWMIGYFYKGMTRCGRCSSEMIWDDELDSYFCKCGMGHSAMWEESFKNRLK